MAEYQSTQVPIRSNTMALGIAGDVDMADIPIDVFWRIGRLGLMLCVFKKKLRS